MRPWTDRQDATSDGEQRAGRIRVLIADDHAVVREGLRMYLGLGGEFEVVGEAGDGREAVAAARRLRPHVVLMDILMPRVDGITATERIRRDLPDVQVLALTSVLADTSVSGAIRAGAVGYVLKTANGDELRQALRAAAAGRPHLAPDAAARLMRELRAPARDALTPRELEVLQLVAAGLPNKEIARRLVITEKTVKTHVSSVLAKLGVTSRTQAVLHALGAGLVTIPGPDGDRA